MINPDSISVQPGQEEDRQLTLSVIIPVHGKGTTICTCLSSLMKCASQPEEIIVVVDGDAEASVEIAEKFAVKVLRLADQGGPARARNTGARAACSDILYFLDSDVSVKPETITQVKNAFNTFPEIDALIGSYDDDPSESNLLSQYKNLLHHYVHQTSNEEACTFWGACGAIRRDVFMAVNEFDEAYHHPSIEDVELGYRLKKQGYRVIILKELQVKHLKRWSVVSLFTADFFRRGIPWTELILRDRMFLNDLNTTYSNRAKVVLIYLILLMLVAAYWSTMLLSAVGFLCALLVALDLSLYKFFRQKRGLFFAVRTIPWHSFYHFYCGLAFAFGTIRYYSKKS